MTDRLRTLRPLLALAFALLGGCGGAGSEPEPVASASASSPPATATAADPVTSARAAEPTASATSAEPAATATSADAGLSVALAAKSASADSAPAACADAVPEAPGPAYPADTTAGAYPLVNKLYQRPEGTPVAANGPNDGVSNKYSDPWPGSLGGKYLLFHRNDFVRLKGQGYFVVRWEYGYFNRGGVLGPSNAPTLVATTGKLVKVAHANRFQADPWIDNVPGGSGLWRAGYQWVNPNREFTPITLSSDTDPTLPSLWSQDYYYLDGEATITNLESGADYNLGITPKTWANVRDDLVNTRPYDGQLNVRYGVSLDPYKGSMRPASPTGLVADVQSDSRVQLKWNDCSGNEAGFVAEVSYAADICGDAAHTKSYKVGEVYTSTASVPVGSNSVEIGFLLPSTTYAMRVHAYNDAGTSAWSNVVQFTTPAAQPLSERWRGADINGPGRTVRGSASQTKGSFALRANDGWLYNTDDSLYFVYQKVTGDLTMTARVVGGSMSATRVGIDVRQSLASNAAHVVIVRESSFYPAGYGRGRDGNGTSGTRGPSLTPGQPTWLRLVRRGNTVTSYWSADGATWVKLKASNLVIDPAVSVGLISLAVGSQSTATFDNVKLTTP